MYIYALFTLAVFAIPTLAYAQDAQSFVANLTTVIGTVFIPFLIGVAFLFFIINVIRYFVIGAGDTEKREKARALALYGILAFVLMVVFAGIVNMLATSLGLEDTDTPCPDYNPSCASPEVVTDGIGSGFGDGTPTTDDLPDSSGMGNAADPDPAPPAPPQPPAQPAQPPETPPTPPSTPGITGGDYHEVGEDIHIELGYQFDNDIFINTFATDEFSQIRRNDLTDDHRLEIAKAFRQSGIITRPELDRLIINTNSIRATEGYGPIDIDLVPEPNPEYVESLRISYTETNAAHNALMSHHQNTSGLRQEEAAERVTRDMTELFSTETPLVDRIDSVYNTYYQLAGTPTSNQRREAILNHFIATVNAEIETTGANNGQLLTREDITG